MTEVAREQIYPFETDQIHIEFYVQDLQDWRFRIIRREEKLVVQQQKSAEVPWEDSMNLDLNRKILKSALEYRYGF